MKGLRITESNKKTLGLLVFIFWVAILGLMELILLFLVRLAESSVWRNLMGLVDSQLLEDILPMLFLFAVVISFILPAFLEVLVFRFYFVSKKTKDFLLYLILGWFGQIFFFGAIHTIFLLYGPKTFERIIREIFFGSATIVYLIPQFIVAVLATVILIKTPDPRRRLKFLALWSVVLFFTPFFFSFLHHFFY